MNGWCPVHDRVYEAGDGLCPRCGTALVTVGVEPPGGPVEARVEPPAAGPSEAKAEAGPAARLPRALVAGVVAAVAAAFAIGLAFPRGRTAAPAAPEQSADRTLGITREAAGVTLRLESFEQHGKRIVARVSVLTPGFDLGLLRSADLGLETGPGASAAEVTLETRTTVRGFVIEGEAVPDAAIPISGLTISSLNLLDEERFAEVRLDLAGVWPANPRNAPRTRRIAIPVPLEPPPKLAVVGLVGWADRLEVGIGVGDIPEGWSYGIAYSLQVESSPTSSGVRLDGEALDPATPGYTVVFREVPVGARSARLLVLAGNVRVGGGWNWRW